MPLPGLTAATAAAGPELALDPRVVMAASWLSAQHTWMPLRRVPVGSTTRRSCSTELQAEMAEVNAASLMPCQRGAAVLWRPSPHGASCVHVGCCKGVA